MSAWGADCSCSQGTDAQSDASLKVAGRVEQTKRRQGLVGHLLPQAPSAVLYGRNKEEKSWPLVIHSISHQ